MTLITGAMRQTFGTPRAAQPLASALAYLLTGWRRSRMGRRRGCRRKRRQAVNPSPAIAKGTRQSVTGNLHHQSEAQTAVWIWRETGVAGGVACGCAMAWAMEAGLLATLAARRSAQLARSRPRKFFRTRRSPCRGSRLARIEFITCTLRPSGSGPAHTKVPPRAWCSGRGALV